MRSLYIISGPLGVGKSTVASALASSLGNASLVVGDDLYNLEGEVDLEWHEKLQKAWDRILPRVKQYLESGQDVVLDFVIEDELPQIRKYLPGIQIHYCILVADKPTLHQRLAKRGELKYEPRSFELLEKLSKEPANKSYILDTVDKDVAEIVETILDT